MTDANAPSPQSWRAVIAALANDDLRTEYARLVLHGEPSSPKRADQLLRAGLAESDGKRIVPANAALRAMLASRDPSTERPQRGPQRFLRPDGRIDRYPAQFDDRVALLQFVAEETFAPGEHLDERELNNRLQRFDDDVALLRRYLIDYGIAQRAANGADYRVRAAEAAAP
ncbi:DUF2087 domain-containing protein [Curtobacterium ammoniigenes]|uniref:DUF2087 domain-containing protein n=1 Tax=Curtobacterium ammoniigenes TaxID=395387 RepID=UPI000837A853|nr:DUF2087 domain-containing protein [Curtobacterium ammoniigenes]